MPVDALPVEHLFTLRVATAPPVLVVGGPQGTRAIVDAGGGGTFEGPRLRGVAKGPGGDWVTARADGSAKLDVRLLLETDDGHAVLMTYQGILAPGGGIRTAPLFEAGDGPYAWLNQVQAVGVGEVVDGGVTYEVYALR
jgi:hypothetical protein